MGNIYYLRSLIGAKDPREKCEILHKSIDRGNDTADIEDEYLSLISSMGKFLDKLQEFASNIGK